MTTTKKKKFINLTAAQVKFLKEEMVLLLEADDYPLEQRLLAATIYKKLEGRTPDVEGD